MKNSKTAEELIRGLEWIESCLKNEMPIDIGSVQQLIAKAEGGK